MTIPVASDVGIFSTWFYHTGGGALFCASLPAADPVFDVVTTGGEVTFTWRQDGSTYQIASDSGPTAGWNHVSAAWTLGATKVVQIYLNGTSATNVLENDTLTPPWPTVTQWAVGRTTHGFDDTITSSDLVLSAGSGLAELYFAPGQLLDLSIAEDREKFRSAAGETVDLGVTGSIPTGVVPLVYLHLARSETPNHFVLNRSGLGDFLLMEL